MDFAMLLAMGRRIAGLRYYQKLSLESIHDSVADLHASEEDFRLAWGIATLFLTQLDS